MELHVLMQALEKLQTQEQYAGVIFGGDLNFEPDSPEHTQDIANLPPEDRQAIEARYRYAIRMARQIDFRFR